MIHASSPFGRARRGGFLARHGIWINETSTRGPVRRHGASRMVEIVGCDSTSRRRPDCSRPLTSAACRSHRPGMATIWPRWLGAVAFLGPMAVGLLVTLLGTSHYSAAFEAGAFLPFGLAMLTV